MRLIDADALIEFSTLCMTQDDEWAVKVSTIESAPTVLTPDPVKHGHWHDVYMLSQETVTQTCSCCQNTIVKNIAHWFNYCPACGAKMDLDG